MRAQTRDPPEATQAVEEAARLRAEVDRLQAELAEAVARAETAEALAERDTLTPLLNRRGFLRELSRAAALARRHGTPSALVFVDLDGFKSINDRFGHAAGDAALIHVAEVFKANVRESDAAARLAGDEFAILLLQADQAAGVAKAQDLEARLADSGFAWGGEPAPLSGSFGVAVWRGQADPEAWLAEADAAMFLRKRTAR
jgi:diguanylate cyclase (GGDEF)-like protein